MSLIALSVATISYALAAWMLGWRWDSQPRWALAAGMVLVPLTGGLCGGAWAVMTA